MKRFNSAVLSVPLVFLLAAEGRAQATGVQPQQQAMERELERAQNLERRARIVTQVEGLAIGGQSVPILTIGVPPDGLNFYQGGGGRGNGAWWTNTALVQRLGLSDDQKARIERAFENHRQTIMSATELLEKEETQLARLMDAETLDRNAILSQTDRVIQARAEVERANAAMTLEMREHLTRAQWLGLPRATFINAPAAIRGGAPRSAEPVPPGTAPRGGQRRGPGQP